MINSDRIEYINNNLSAFDFSVLQNLNSLLRHMQDTGITRLDFFDWINHKVEEIRISNEKDMEEMLNSPDGGFYLKCPLCGRMMVLNLVNSNSGDVVGGGYSSQASCHDRVDCGFEIFLKIPIEKISQDIIDEEFKKIGE